MAAIHRALAFMILGISAILLSGYLFFNEKNINFDSIADLRFVNSLPSGFLTKFKEKDNEYIYAFLELNGSFHGDIRMKVDNINIAIYKKDAPINISLDSGKLNVQKEVNLINYSGDVLYYPEMNTFILEGKVKKLILPSASFEIEKEGKILCNSSITDLEKMELEHITQDVIELKGFKGNINIKIKNDKISYVTSNKDVKILRIKGTLTLKGNKIVFKGEGIIKTDVLLTPAKIG